MIIINNRKYSDFYFIWLIQNVSKQMIKFKQFLCDGVSYRNGSMLPQAHSHQFMDLIKSVRGLHNIDMQF